MKEKLQKYKTCNRRIESTMATAKLNDVRVSILGKKGELTAVFKRNERCISENHSKSRTVGKRNT